VARFVALRALQAVAIVFLVATLTFVLLHVAPGDPFAARGEASGAAGRELLAQHRRNFGLDRPIAEQYLRYLGRLARGDLGISFAERRPAWRAIRDRLPNTLLLAAAALLVDFAVGIAIGVVQGARPGSPRDTWLSLASLTLYSVPVFWLGVMLLLVFSQWLGWLPAGGAADPVTYPYLSTAGRAWDRLKHLALPAATLGLVGAATTARYQRAAMLEVVRQDFVRAARARGLAERAVLLRHALRNALLPVITLFGLSLPILLSGAVLVETVFSWPGMGKLAVDSIFERDYFVVTGAAVLAAAMVLAGSLAADLLYAAVDPRAREAA
jgi:peptide/nickel transport system permease protein